MLHWGIIGASTIAKQWMIHAINHCSDSQVVALLTQSSERGQAFQEQFHIQNIYSNLQEFLAHPDLDVVYIGTTNEYHYPQTLASATAQKHVLCEKPLALSLSDAKQMVEACSEAGVVMGTNHHLRNAVTHRKLRQLIRDNTIGAPWPYAYFMLSRFLRISKHGELTILTLVPVSF